MPILILSLVTPCSGKLSVSAPAVVGVVLPPVVVADVVPAVPFLLSLAQAAITSAPVSASATTPRRLCMDFPLCLWRRGARRRTDNNVRFDGVLGMARERRTTTRVGTDWCECARASVRQA